LDRVHNRPEFRERREEVHAIAQGFQRLAAPQGAGEAIRDGPCQP